MPIPPESYNASMLVLMRSEVPARNERSSGFLMTQSPGSS